MHDYVLGGTDYHLENIIASGEHPVLVDLEMMLQALPRPGTSGRWNLRINVRQKSFTTPCCVRAYLPGWILSKLGESVDMSGIGAEDPQDTGFLRPDWDDINTDRIRIVDRSPPLEPETHRPMLIRKVVSARDHISAITIASARCTVCCSPCATSCYRMTAR